MPDYPIYAYKEVLDDEFPFKVEIRNPQNMNRSSHAHEHLQLCYMMSGTCLHWAAGEQYVLTKGDLFSIPPFLEHRLGPRDAMDFVMIQIDFMPHAINESFRDLARMQTFVDFAYIQPLISETDLMPKMALPAAAQAEVEHLLNDILAEWERQEDGFRIAIKADLLKFLVIAGRQYKRHAQTQRQHARQKVTQHREAFHDAVAYMETHYDEDLHLEEMAAKALMAPSYFSHMLRLVRGKSYIEYLSAVRIQASMELLEGTDLNVTEIAAKVGYNHISHFNRTFKKHTGVTPGDFRRHRP
ncbi:AraC family transcriptional regulator [Paenibacillus sacheonensis]|uniref:Helix-turn-helix domain-containing protein n=1 Tax=Paenibacillus sacheonensis TaxID=742054 RepID=A0A7X4YJB7_9BACL|nr:AraC family transcriptional regulator [Paenibacillus sacheonensis]MBM7564303.1 AraC-like DNA-binding protein/mannose-6-phosphate isomerase-like protein (cupin superfamily) [Paenibacillus sacheonensis]NBC67375.1 helix-turn-helix domain-containing protein [Paenibacillus sacheonensis]